MIDDDTRPRNEKGRTRAFSNGGRRTSNPPSPSGNESVVRLDDAYLSLTRGLPAYSGLSERTLRSYLTDPSDPLPFYRFGGKLLVRRSEFDKWALRFRIAPDANGSLVDAAVSDILRGL